MMRFSSLGSGSTGNGTLIEASDGTRTTRLLVDCGFTLKELGLRLARLGLAPAMLDGIFITHEHGDHVGCALSLAKRHGVPVWMSRGTWRAMGEPDRAASRIHFARDGESIALGGLELNPYTVPHDAYEPLQLSIGDGASRLGLLTDAGSVTAHLLAQLQRCDALLLECNHDRTMLAGSRYPASVKSRIGGAWGHLANDTAGEILSVLKHGRLRHLVAGHLSEQNNTPALAAAALAAAVGAQAADIVVADPVQGFSWLDLR